MIRIYINLFNIYLLSFPFNLYTCIIYHAVFLCFQMQMYHQCDCRRNAQSQQSPLLTRYVSGPWLLNSCRLLKQIKFISFHVFFSLFPWMVTDLCPQDSKILITGITFFGYVILVRGIFFWWTYILTNVRNMIIFFSLWTFHQTWARNLREHSKKYLAFLISFSNKCNIIV